MSISNKDMIPGETMFDYLKRKKKAMLEKTLSSNRGGGGREIGSLRAEGDYDNTKRNQSKQTTSRSMLKGKLDVQSQSTTPKRVTLIEEERRPATRSFLQMISPIRSKSPLQKEVQSLKSSPRFNKKQLNQNYSKRVMQEKVGNLQDLIQNLIKSGRTLKQKFHFLFVELQPYLKHVENCESSKIERKTEVIRAQLKAVEHNFREFSIDASQQNIASFLMAFSQYVNEFEGNGLAEIEANKNGLVAQINKAKNGQIAELKDEKRRLEKQVNLYKKQCQKLLKRYEDLDSDMGNQWQKSQKDQIQSISKLQDQLNNQRQLTHDLKDQVEQLTDMLRIKECQIKKMRYDGEKYREQALNTLTKVKSEQQQFLLAQIVIMKKEFNTDIQQMTQLHQTKEEQYIYRIKGIVKDNELLKGRMQEMVQSTLQMQEISRTNEAQAIRYKKQNQMLAIDMHRINQQLYQHWLALKDIKTLSLRLDIFSKFKKIYQELLFNQQLFL